MGGFENIMLSEIITVSLTLFAVIDMLGSVPVLLSLKKKMGDMGLSGDSNNKEGGLFGGKGKTCVVNRIFAWSPCQLVSSFSASPRLPCSSSLVEMNVCAV